MRTNIQNTSRHLFSTICVSWFLCCAVGMPAHAEDRKLITEDFVSALEAVKPEAFFSSPLPEHKEIPPQIGVSTEELIRSNTILKTGLYAGHYQKIGDDLCKPINEAYIRMIGDGIDGKYAYAFDEELTRSMRRVGAYTLPILLLEKEETQENPAPPLVKATYYNPDWNRDATDLTRGHKIFAELYEATTPYTLDLFYQDKGRLGIEIKQGKYDYLNFKQFYDLAVTQKSFETKKFNTDFDFSRTYLFTFVDGLGDQKKSSVFYYVDFPFSVVGSQYGVNDKLFLKPENTAKIQCKAITNASMFLVGTHYPKKFYEKKKAISSMNYLEPLTVPLYSHYGRTDFFHRDNQQRIVERTNSYDVQEGDISEPSLKCWMIALGFDSGDQSQCRDTGYADEFKKMYNNNVCVWSDGVTKTPEITYPYSADAGVQMPAYYRQVTHFEKRCQSH